MLINQIFVLKDLLIGKLSVMAYPQDPVLGPLLY